MQTVFEKKGKSIIKINEESLMKLNREGHLHLLKKLHIKDWPQSVSTKKIMG